MATAVCPQNVLQQVCKQALSQNNTSQCTSCSFILGTENGQLGGGEAVVFALQDHLGRKIGARIQRKSTEATSYIVSKEVEYLKAIESFNIARFQKVIDYEIHGNLLIRAPFIALEWADGEPLRWTDTSPADLSHRQKVIRAIAEATLDLLQIQRPGDSAREYINSRINRKIKRAERSNYPGGEVDGCRTQLELLEEFWDAALETAPHVLIHGDLSDRNIIVNGDSDVEKIIDLGWSDMVPLQFAAVYPRFLTYQPSQVCSENGDIVSFDWSVKHTSIMIRDRAFYLDCIKRRALSKGGIALDFYKVLARHDESRRYWWFRAVHQVDAHRAMVACDWNPGHNSRCG